MRTQCRQALCAQHGQHALRGCRPRRGHAGRSAGRAAPGRTPTPGARCRGPARKPSRRRASSGNLMMHHGVERTVEQERGAQGASAPRSRRSAPGCAASGLSSAWPSASLCLTSSRSRLAAARHISASSLAPGFGAALPLPGSRTGRSRSKRALLQGAVQAARDAPPHDPVIGPAFRASARPPACPLGGAAACSSFQSCSTRKRSQRIAEAGPQAVADQVVPAAQMRRRAAALLGDLGQELPQPPAQPVGHCCRARVQGRFQRLGQVRVAGGPSPLRKLARISSAASCTCRFGPDVGRRGLSAGAASHLPALPLTTMSRTLNSSRQRLSPSLATHHSSSVPISVERAASVTGHAARCRCACRRAGSCAAAAAAAAASGATCSTSPALSPPRTVEVYSGKATGCPAPAPARVLGSAISWPSSRCCGTTHRTVVVSPGRAASLALDADVVRPGDAAADAPAAGVPEPGVVGRSPGDGQVERRVGQHQRLPRAGRARRTSCASPRPGARAERPAGRRRR